MNRGFFLKRFDDSEQSIEGTEQSYVYLNYEIFSFYSIGYFLTFLLFRKER